MTMMRRDFLWGSAALAAMPAVSRSAWGAPLPREADIVVIGAGAAGIAAARRVAAANRRVIVVEAASQAGGRCMTDSSTFDVPFDRGARWIHNPETNPMIRLARSAGLDITPAPSGQKIRIGRRNARPGETEEFLAALVKASFTDLPTWLFSWQMFLVVLGFFSGIKHRFRGGAWLIMMLIGGAFLYTEINPDVSIRRYIWPVALIRIPW